MTISKELLDELPGGVDRPEDVLGDKGLMKERKIRLMERMPGGELTAHLGYEEGKDAPLGQFNRRNGTASKRLKGQDGTVRIDILRFRDGSFSPELIQKGQTPDRWDGWQDHPSPGQATCRANLPRGGLYAAGLSTRDIRAHLEEVYGPKVPADLVSGVTGAVLAEVSDWQNRALEPMYPIVIFDAPGVNLGPVKDRDAGLPSV